MFRWMVYARLEPWLPSKGVRVVGVGVVVVLFAIMIGATGSVAAQSTVGQDGNFTDMTGQDEAVVEVGAGPSGFKFDPADIRIDPGTTVVWTWTGRGSQHNVVESDGEEILDDPAFESELTAEEGFEFTYTFDEPGTYDYVCSVHLAQDMVGSVEVVEGEGGGDGTGDGMDGNETDTDGNSDMGGNETGTNGGSGNGNESM